MATGYADYAAGGAAAGNQALLMAGVSVGIGMATGGLTSGLSDFGKFVFSVLSDPVISMAMSGGKGKYGVADFMNSAIMGGLNMAAGMSESGSGNSSSAVQNSDAAYQVPAGPPPPPAVDGTSTDTYGEYDPDVHGRLESMIPGIDAQGTDNPRKGLDDIVTAHEPNTSGAYEKGALLLGHEGGKTKVHPVADGPLIEDVTVIDWAKRSIDEQMAVEGTNIDDVELTNIPHPSIIATENALLDKRSSAIGTYKETICTFHIHDDHEVSFDYLGKRWTLESNYGPSPSDHSTAILSHQTSSVSILFDKKTQQYIFFNNRRPVFWMSRQNFLNYR